MLDKLEELEGKVLALVKLLQERGEASARLEQEKHQLQHELENTRDKLRILENENAELQQVIDNNAARETEIRERLGGILDRLSRFEVELTSADLGGFQ